MGLSGARFEMGPGFVDNLAGARGGSVDHSEAVGQQQKVTVIIPAGNEADQIEEAASTVLWADEILVVVDAASNDGTLERVRTLKDPRVRAESHPYGYSAAQKNWAIPRATHPWVFLLDADERCTKPLRDEIQALLSGEPDRDAYWIQRENLFFGRVMKHGGWQTDKVIRLFRRECRYQDTRVRAEIEGWTTVGALQHPLQHSTFRGWAHYLTKLDQHTTWGAEQDFKEGKGAGMTSVLLRPTFHFIKQYIIRLGFLDGIPGAIAVYLGVYGVFLKYAKLWDMGRRKRIAPRDDGAGNP